MDAQKMRIATIERRTATVSTRIRLKGVVKTAAMTIRAMVREVFDEAAYERYLDRNHAERSKESYRSFLEERQTLLASKFRCC